MTNDYFIAPSADVYGDVRLAKDTSIWFQSVLRGDNNSITINAGSNVQDSTVIHVDKDAPVVIGENVTIGHHCMLHGCKIEDGALIGMSSTILNRATIGKNSLIGAGSLVTEGTEIPANVLAFGRPAKVIRPLTREELRKNKENAQHYVERSKEFAADQYPRLT
ncbi:gamma carbonic anhydrase family protein [Enterococcus ureilyticus]|uniref:Gamma carbonic anhydrase family protein n=1 Tax=Enterococcus ureilyticus TaxID=1131292 RepID=A0A1E5HF63_9ENTE|nr:gamma carbonic anhydrase family protein [Enterococcus ureilyticus]MBM7689315.1 carbonic anhydrase/acetyltransferase-like protein (isoleucine patch superfamily) [Enterococcus ureilyticus]OEG23584.1 gamma carbonic anhydrase family protein [Enterococcus ureilyticus]